MIRLFRWLSRRPLGLLHTLGAGVGWIGYLLSPTYRHRFRDHVRQAGVSAAAARAAIAEAGRMVMELPFLWLRPATRPLAEFTRIEGAELVAAAHADGRGLLLLTPHLGCFEICAQAYAERFAPQYGPVTVLYRPAKQGWLREVIESSRARPGLATAPASLAGVRQMIRALRRGETVGLLPDQVPPEGMGEWAPFFGRPAYTMTLAARLAQQTGAAVLLIWGERLRGGRGYVVRILPMNEALPVDVAAQAESAAVINRAMESLIRQCPQQYLWGYHRFKEPRAGAAE
ncbi:lysophospholipid acyltransferase family protein [uncultured Piscinibacter sp.]|uniref:lysophospholipid acyltransferase family protein n=1 Tax=uncultured Piscinibacter sp. TaxID=1131835 RepID=UPI00260AF232|nr:lysophospholipid acyltransferase family protein [uncultured Piscinibacter sp.]